MARAVLTIRKKIHFCYVYLDKDIDQRIDRLDQSGLFGEIARVQRQLIRNRYIVDEDGDESTCRLLAQGARSAFLATTTSWNSMPMAERRDGSLRELQIAADEGIAYLTHVKFVAPSIVGVEYNHTGPRVGTIRDFFRERFPTFRRIQFEAIIDPDVLDQLEHMSDFRTLRVRLPFTAFERLPGRPADFLADLDNIQETLGGQVLDLFVTAKRGKDGLNDQRVRAFVRGMIRVAGLVDGDTQLQVRGYDDRAGRVVPLDLLRSRLVSEQDIRKLPGRSRVVDSDDAFQKISRAYEEVRDRVPQPAYQRR